MSFFPKPSSSEVTEVKTVYSLFMYGEGMRARERGGKIYGGGQQNVPTYVLVQSEKTGIPKKPMMTFLLLLIPVLLQTTLSSHAFIVIVNDVKSSSPPSPSSLLSAAAASSKKKKRAAGGRSTSNSGEGFGGSSSSTTTISHEGGGGGNDNNIIVYPELDLNIVKTLIPYTTTQNHQGGGGGGNILPMDMYDRLDEIYGFDKFNFGGTNSISVVRNRDPPRVSTAKSTRGGSISKNCRI
jgi:hypothetical protein